MHTADTQRWHAPAGVAVFEGIEAGGIHTEQPVANGATESRFVHALIVVLRLEIGKALADALLRERRHPKAQDGTLHPRLLHHPSLDEFAFLPGIAAVHDVFGPRHQPLDDGKLALHTLVVLQANAKALRYHGQLTQGPPLPFGEVVFGIFQFAQVAKGPRHLVTVAFVVALAAAGRAQHAGDVRTHGGFLGNTNYHSGDVIFRSMKRGD